MRRFLILVAILGACISASTSPVSAAYANRARVCSCNVSSPVYPPTSASLTLSTSRPEPGAPLVLTAQGFCPGGLVTFLLDGSIVGTAIADSLSVARFTIIAPAAAGDHVVVGLSTGGDDCTQRAESRFVIGSPLISETGADSRRLLIAAGVTVGVGGLLTAVATIRRRRTSTTA